MRSISIFCVLAGLAGFALTAVNLRYAADYPAQVFGGLALAILCLSAPPQINRAEDYRPLALRLGLIAFAGLAALAILNGSLVGSAGLLLITMTMTYTLVFGVWTGSSFGAATIGLFSFLYFGSYAANPVEIDPAGRLVDWTNIYVALCAAVVFVVAGAAVFRVEVARVSQRLWLANAALARERQSLAARVAERTVEIEAAVARAERANSAKSRFLAAMSHELRTPLSAIIGFTELLREGADEDGRTQDTQDLDRVLAAAGHLLALVSDILDISKVEAGRMTIRAEDCDPAAIAQQAIEALRPKAAAKDIVMESEIAPSVGKARTDGLRLKQCLLNLLSNAVKFTNRGSVTLRAWREGGLLVFEVEDTGTGITPHALDRLFNPFEQDEANAGHLLEGTGLGLAITRRLARAMGGDVTVETALGRGSTFRLTVAAELHGYQRAQSIASL